MSARHRDRIAELLYGDGNELPWARCVALADLIAWELSHQPPEENVT